MSESVAPITFAIGTDIEEIDRFADGSSTEVLFTADELQHAGPLPQGASRRAGTWCAKEAVIKALWPWVHLDPRRIEISRDLGGRPNVRIVGWDPRDNGVHVDVSIAHTERTATASAIAWGPIPQGAAAATDPSRGTHS